MAKQRLYGVKPILLKISVNWIKKLDKIAKDRGICRTDLIRDAIWTKLNKKE